MKQITNILIFMLYLGDDSEENEFYTIIRLVDGGDAYQTFKIKMSPKEFWDKMSEIATVHLIGPGPDDSEPEENDSSPKNGSIL